MKHITGETLSKLINHNLNGLLILYDGNIKSASTNLCLYACNVIWVTEYCYALTLTCDGLHVSIAMYMLLQINCNRETTSKIII